LMAVTLIVCELWWYNITDEVLQPDVAISDIRREI
jgi:hypothetical protein